MLPRAHRLSGVGNTPQTRWNARIDAAKQRPLLRDLLAHAAAGHGSAGVEDHVRQDQQC
jgi:hypothetical protein